MELTQRIYPHFGLTAANDYVFKVLYGVVSINLELFPFQRYLCNLVNIKCFYRRWTVSLQY